MHIKACFASVLLGLKSTALLSCICLLASIFLVPDVLAWVVRLGLIFGCRPWRAGRLSRRRAGVPRAPGVFLPGRRADSGWSAGRDGLQAGNRGGDVGGPGSSFGEPQAQAAAAADEPPGDGEDPQAEPFRFPAAGRAG